MKRQAKPFVDVTVDRTAKGIGGLLALVLIAPWGLNWDWQRVSYASLAVCGLWIFTAIRAKKGYINAFRQGLARGDVEPDTLRLPTADASTIETLVAELADPDEARVRYAIDVLESLDKRNLITPLLLYHESPKVRARALTALAAAPREVAAKWRSGVQRMLGDESAEVRAAAVGALATLGGEAQTDLVRPYLDDANPRIAATAAAVLAGSSKDEDRELAERTLTRLSGASGDRTASRREVAIALRQIRDPHTSLLLVPLLNDANPVVATEAMRTVRERGQGDFLFVPTLVSLLRHRGLKAPARDVLVGYGEEVVPALAHFLRDPEEDIWVRRHVPSTLSRIPCQASMDVLIAALVNEKDAFLRYKCVAAIDRLHGEHPELTFDPKPIETLAWLEGMQFYQFLSYHDNLFNRGGITTACLLKSLLEEKRARARERVFFMLALLYPRRDVMAARWELEHGDARSKASACECPRQRPVRPAAPPADADARGTDRRRTRQQGQRDPADAPARRRGDAADPDQQRRRGRVGGGDRPGRPARAALAGRRPRSRPGPPRRARLARLRGRVLDAGRPAPAVVEAARAVAGAPAERRDRQPAAVHPALRLGRDRRAVPDRARRPAGQARSRPHALRGRRAAGLRPPPAGRPGAGHGAGGQDA